MNDHEVRTARRVLGVKVLALLTAELAVGDDEDAAVVALKASDEVDLAARDLVNAIDDMPESAHPPGWEVSR